MPAILLAGGVAPQTAEGHDRFDVTLALVIGGLARR
jgi:hypothetical protein